MAFCNNLRRIREEKGYKTAKEFINSEFKEQINYTTYIAYESTNRLPPEDLIVKIARALDVSIDELFGYSRIKLKKSEIEICIDTLKEYGIEARMHSSEEKVNIEINGKTITTIPDTELIDIVKTGTSDVFSKMVTDHLRYSAIMRLLIQHAKTRKPVHEPLGKIHKNAKGTEMKVNSKKGKDFSKKVKEELSRLKG